MPKKKSLTQYQPQELDHEEFNLLTDLLFEALEGNVSKIIRVLGITRAAWHRWEHTPPKQHWWTIVLRHIITEVIASIVDKRGMPKKHRKRIKQSLNAIKHTQLVDTAIYLAESYSGATAHLRDTLTKHGGGMFKDEIDKPANSGSYSDKTLRVAAKKLGVQIMLTGYGKNKRSYWRLPVD